MFVSVAAEQHCIQGKQHLFRTNELDLVRKKQTFVELLAQEIKQLHTQL